MSATVNIASSAEWQRLLASSPVVVADFYADWCGPCKMIAPAFESLATKYSKPRRISFCKINVDTQKDIAGSYGVSAMPTFLVFKSGTVVDTIRGANSAALTAAVEKAVKMVGTSAAGTSFAVPGRTLGSAGSSGLGRRSWSWSPSKFMSALVTFFGLYLVSLFSFDPYKAAEASAFNVHNPAASRQSARADSGRSSGAPSAPGRPGGVRTLADIGGS
ncbi:thioredoxin-like protein [Xylariaceae sp. FL0594]|nr:thioredoxin-like protein [Xylariaceae sp. FL0594]